MSPNSGSSFWQTRPKLEKAISIGLGAGEQVDRNSNQPSFGLISSSACSFLWKRTLSRMTTTSPGDTVGGSCLSIQVPKIRLYRPAMKVCINRKARSSDDVSPSGTIPHARPASYWWASSSMMISRANALFEAIRLRSRCPTGPRTVNHHALQILVPTLGDA